MILELLTALAVSVSGMERTDTSGTLVMFWNLENFFDCTDCGGGDSDTEFTPRGTKHWTPARFWRKCEATAKSVFWIADRYGRLPDVIGVAEVENRTVLEKMLHSTSLRKSGYSVLHRDSPDHRGIDVAMMFRRDVFRQVRSGIRRLDSMATRDILFAELEDRRDGKHTVFIVNHFPSKYGGSGTGDRRAVAASALRNLCDSVLASGTSAIVAMGDFNDTPSSPAFDTLRPVLHNLAMPFEASGKGSIRFNGRWDMIDMFWASPYMEEECRMDIGELPFLMTRDNIHAGLKPLRTYSGPRYIGGVSDHCPILLRISQTHVQGEDQDSGNPE
ncbi:MAG: endonuclease/exonuclease/phosphatase family protein [Candidatus Cryptobacteroides sp.]